MLKKIGIFIYKCIRFFLLLVMFLLLWMEIPEAAIFSGCVLILYYFFRLRRKAKKRYEKLQGGFSKFADVYISEADLVRVMVLEELQRYARVGLVPVEEKTRKKRLIATVVYFTAAFALLMGCYYRLSVIGWLTVLTVAYMAVCFRFHPVEELCREVRSQPDRTFGEIVGKKVTETPERPRYIQAIAAAAVLLGVFIAVNRTEKMTFEPIDGGVCLTSYRPGIGGFSQTVTVPETYEGQPVVAIGEGAFSNNQLMETVHLPQTVTTIDSHAFQGCKSLTEIQLPEGLTTLNGESFKNCVSLKQITIPTGVTEIRGNTFEDCDDLETVVLHEGIVEIHAYAFRNCRSLKNITLPTGITEIKAYTFENCKSLEEIEIPVGVVSIRAHAFYGCSALSDVYVPDTVREIRSSAFRLCTSLEKIALPEGVAVDERAFKDSPTTIVKKEFTDAQEVQIRQEWEEKPQPEVLYYIYDESAPDEVRPWGTGIVLIADDKRFADELEQGEVLAPLNGYAEVLAFLEKAKQAGMSDVMYAWYSETATQVTGDTCFLGREMTVEEMIAICNEQTGESND